MTILEAAIPAHPAEAKLLQQHYANAVGHPADVAPAGLYGVWSAALADPGP